MGYKWMLQLYCDKCHAGQHFEGENMNDCVYQAQHEGWFERDDGTLLCERCNKVEY